MQDMFSSVSSPYSHDFDASTHETCEASRRALLSQGYMASLPQPDTVDATKNFQPTPDSHVVMSFHVVCAPGENASNTQHRLCERGAGWLYVEEKRHVGECGL